MAKIKITLIKSTIGCIKVQKDTVTALGLTKIGTSKVFANSDSLQGMINRVSHLVKCEEVDE